MSDSAFGLTPDEEWEALMRQLRAQPAARPRPFFYGRLNARLATGRSNQGRPIWLLRPAYAVLLGAVVLSLSGDGRVLRPAADTTPGRAADGRLPPGARPH